MRVVGREVLYYIAAVLNDSHGDQLTGLKNSIRATEFEFTGIIPAHRHVVGDAQMTVAVD